MKFGINTIMKSFFYIAKKTWKVVVFVGVALLPQLAWAASEGVNLGTISPPVGDLSVILLGKIFGTVGGGLETAGPTIFGQMFYVFNSGILIVIGFILIYTTFKSVMEVAHGDTGQMSRKFTWWQVARVVLGAGAVVPQATGYSVINTIVIWVVIQGVGLADAVWTQAVNYLSRGGSLYISSSSSSSATQKFIDSQLVFSTTQANTVAGNCEQSGKAGCMTAANVLNSQVCMNYLYNVVEASRVKRLKDVKDNPTSYATKDGVKLQQMLQTPVSRFREVYTEDKDKWFVMFPGNADKVLPPKSQIDTVDLNGLCGTYRWGVVPSVAGKESDMDAYRAAKETGLRQMVLGLSQIADDSANFYKDKASTTDFPKSFHETTYTTLVNTAANYQSVIQPMRLYASNNYKQERDKTVVRKIPNPSYDSKKAESDSNKKEFEVYSDETINPADMTKDGWISAGSFYFLLSTAAQSFGGNDKNYYVDIFYSDTKHNYDPPRCDAQSGTFPTCNKTYTDTLTKWFKDYLPGVGSGSGQEYLDLLKDRLIWNDANVVVKKPGQSQSIFAEAQDWANQLNAAAQKSGGEVYLPDVLKKFASGSSTGVSISIPSAGITWAVQLIVLDPLNKNINNVFKAWYSGFIASDARGKFPILQLQILGQTMINEFFDFWSGVFTALGGIMWGYLVAAIVSQGVAIGLAVCSFWGTCTGGTIAAEGVMSFLQLLLKMFIEIPMAVVLPLASSVSILLLLNGVILAYYIPMLPFMLFLFGVISWFSFVIEGMVAAPLIALGITHPEGHDLLGKSEQALMLLVAVFVRPTVMIFGLLAGMVLSYVAMDVLNAGFGKLIESIYYNKVDLKSDFIPTINRIVTITEGQGSSAASQVQNVAMILVYTLIVMSLMQQCFSLIHSLPSAIMTWIGLHHREGQEAHLAEAVKGGLSQAAEKAGAGVGEAARGMQFGGLQSRGIGTPKDETKGPDVTGAQNTSG